MDGAATTTSHVPSASHLAQDGQVDGESTPRNSMTPNPEHTPPVAVTPTEAPGPQASVLFLDTRFQQYLEPVQRDRHDAEAWIGVLKLALELGDVSLIREAYNQFHTIFPTSVCIVLSPVCFLILILLAGCSLGRSFGVRVGAEEQPGGGKFVKHCLGRFHACGTFISFVPTLCAGPRLSRSDRVQGVGGCRRTT